MSFGIGEAISALEFTWTVCEKLVNAPSEVAEVKNATKRVQKELKHLDRKMKDKNSHFFQAEKEMSDPSVCSGPLSRY